MCIYFFVLHYYLVFMFHYDIIYWKTALYDTLCKKLLFAVPKAAFHRPRSSFWQAKKLLLAKRALESVYKAAWEWGIALVFLFYKTMPARCAAGCVCNDERQPNILVHASSSCSSMCGRVEEMQGTGLQSWQYAIPSVFPLCRMSVFIAL